MLSLKSQVTKCLSLGIVIVLFSVVCIYLFMEAYLLKGYSNTLHFHRFGGNTSGSKTVFGPSHDW